jgi:hypothetical protein
MLTPPTRIRGGYGIFSGRRNPARLRKARGANILTGSIFILTGSIFHFSKNSVFAFASSISIFKSSALNFHEFHNFIFKSSILIRARRDVRHSGTTRPSSSCKQSNYNEEDLMVNQLQATTRPALIQAARDLGPLLLFSALGLFTAFYLISQQASHATAKTTPRTAAANVSPELYISPASLEPNLNGVLVTGDGAASIPLEELVAGVRREAFNDMIHGKKLAANHTH